MENMSNECEPFSVHTRKQVNRQKEIGKIKERNKLHTQHTLPTYHHLVHSPHTWEARKEKIPFLIQKQTCIKLMQCARCWRSFDAEKNLSFHFGITEANSYKIMLRHRIGTHQRNNGNTNNFHSFGITRCGFIHSQQQLWRTTIVAKRVKWLKNIRHFLPYSANTAWWRD